MSIRFAIAATLMAVAAPGAARQSDQATVSGGSVPIPNFTFSDGSKLAELKISYTAIGKPHRNEKGEIDNAVLLLHGTGGKAGNFLAPGLDKALFGPGAPFDQARYYVIMPDAIGHGSSAKPSDGLRMTFPHYDYADMVEAQHRLLTEYRDIRKLKAIVGMSMGCMVTFQWATTYPGFAEKFVPMACYPVEIAGQNRMQRKLSVDAIKTDPAWRNGNYETQPLTGLRAATSIAMLMSSSPLNLQTSYPTRAAADKYVDESIAGSLAGDRDANDAIYQIDASRTYNPWDKLGRIHGKLLWVNFADDLVNPVSLGIVDKALARMPTARFVLIPASEKTRGHGTLFQPEYWGDVVAKFLAE